MSANHDSHTSLAGSFSWARFAGWTLFAVSFGYAEAALVVYFRHILGMRFGMDYRTLFAGGDSPSPSRIAMELHRRGVLALERSREAATLLLLVGAAWAGGRTRRERWAIAAYTFAAWDLTYYLFLALLTGFPRSLAETDIYFLLPIVIYGPVWFPVLIVMPALIGISAWLWRADRGAS